MRVPITINVHLDRAGVVPQMDLIQASDGRHAWPRVMVGPDVSLFFNDLAQAEAFGAAIVAQARALRPADISDPCEVELGAGEAPVPVVAAEHLGTAPEVRR